jgi:hypothetical protein
MAVGPMTLIPKSAFAAVLKRIRELLDGPRGEMVPPRERVGREDRRVSSTMAETLR